MTHEQVRVLIVDDSTMMRFALRAMLESDPAIRVVGEAANGKEALDKVAALQPNVITMDVRMPVMDGLETTERLMAYHPTPVLVITASLNSYEIDITFRMLEAGALDVIEKPSMHDPADLDRSRQALIRRVKAMARMRVVTHLRGRRRAASSGQWVITDGAAADGAAVGRSAAEGTAAEGADVADSIPADEEPVPPLHAEPAPPALNEADRPVATRLSQGGIPLIVIGASAGGPRVVQHILQRLPISLEAAVIVAQHIAEGFSAGMVDWLADTTPLRVQLALKPLPLTTGSVFIAPDGCDLVVRADKCVFGQARPPQPQHPRPSVDVAMQSAVAVFGSFTIGVLLTGMGRDGALGMREIYQQGGYTMAQNETTAPIYGMPRAAVELGVVHAILPPDEIVLALQRQVRKLRSSLAFSDSE
jgi:two-component system chemotaxis response regulator CheB